MLDYGRNRREPLYHQVREVVRNNIESGVWPPNQQLPNEFEVAKMFGVSRTTVRSAFSELTREGLLRQRPGQGTFVIGPRPEADLSRVQDLMTGLLALGPGSAHRPVHESIRPATADIARLLGIPPRSKVREIVRLRLERGEPILIAKYHMPADRVPDLCAEDFAGEVPYAVLAKRCGIKIARGRTWLEPTVADEYEAKLLGIAVHSPCMLIRRLLEDEDQRVVISTKMLLRGDKCRYVISWEQQHQA
jgi:GntR family transcriptional regulator